MISTTTRRAAKPNRFPAAFAIAAAAAVVVPAHAKSSRKPSGVWAWTRGSQTYIRARPSVDTPPVAKVARHTKLFVWGKFDGWYRVETTDHKFGWIYNSYLTPSNKEKIAELSHRRARLASNRTEHQTMYGSSQMLRAHYARYGAKGALVGLQKNGVRVRIAPTRIAQARAASTRIKAPRLATKHSRKAAPRLASATSKPRVSRALTKAPIAAPRLASTRAAIARPNAAGNLDTRDENRLTRTPDGIISSQSRRNDIAPNDTVSKTDAASEKVSAGNAETKRDEARRATLRAEEARLGSLRAEEARLEKQRLREQNLAQAQRDAEAQRAADTQRLAQAQQDAAARAANDKARRFAEAQRAAQAEENRRANAQREFQARRAAAQRREAARRAASEKRRAARLARVKARRQRAQRLAARKAAEREELRRRMSMTPPSPQAAEAGLRPLSPEELLRARESYLSSRHKSRPSAPRMPQQPAASTRDNLFERNPPAGSAFNRQPMSQEQPSKAGDVLQQMSYTPRGGAFAMNALHTRGGGFVLASQKVAAQKSSARPADARFSRGGSPRDFALNRSRNLGESVAMQALSYRGMPYIRGASSSRRGFDCSGLVYFLMRQRGYNPPRTAGGLASYGKPVSRRALQAGDIVLFANTYKRGVSHVGVYIGNNNFVHAANSRSGVKTDSLTSGYYARKYYGARRVQ